MFRFASAAAASAIAFALVLGSAPAVSASPAGVSASSPSATSVRPAQNGAGLPELRRAHKSLKSGLKQLARAQAVMTESMSSGDWGTPGGVVDLAKVVALAGLAALDVKSADLLFADAQTLHSRQADALIAQGRTPVDSRSWSSAVARFQSDRSAAAAIATALQAAGVS